MSKQEDSTIDKTEDAGGLMQETGDSSARADEAGDVAEPDAPTGVEENSGMNTILGSGSGTGVQTDADDE
ncbi:MAG: hypothetical protein QOF02_2664 [Blastocatellia bacterium]|jgi:hypothetical protein|nr:hypothetical protein [Blastocatellia bacterium]